MWRYCGRTVGTGARAESARKKAGRNRGTRAWRRWRRHPRTAQQPTGHRSDGYASEDAVKPVPKLAAGLPSENPSCSRPNQDGPADHNPHRYSHRRRQSNCTARENRAQANANGSPERPSRRRHRPALAAGVACFQRIVVGIAIEVPVPAPKPLRILANKPPDRRIIIPRMVVVNPSRRVILHPRKLEPIPVACIGLGHDVAIRVVDDVVEIGARSCSPRP